MLLGTAAAAGSGHIFSRHFLAGTSQPKGDKQDETASITARSKMRPCTHGGWIEVGAVRPDTTGPVASQF